MEEKKNLDFELGFRTLGVDSIEKYYEVIEDIGFGTYGEVQKCKDLETGKIVALKRIKKLNGEDGFPKMVIREVRLLQKLNHVNIVRLNRVLHCKGTVFLVFEYCEFDLSALLYMPGIPPLKEFFVRSIMRQLLVSLQYLNSQRVIHRDLKPSNMFITRNNILKIGDFGLARDIQNYSRYSTQVITQWYRPPELLLGQDSYGTEVDIWSAGCILYEMITKRPLFVAHNQTDVSQLHAIFRICGTPNSKNWPDWENLKNAKILANEKPIPSQLRDYLDRHIPDNFKGIIPLLMHMIVLDPKKRIPATTALEQPFFSENANFTDPRNLPPIKLEEIHQSDVSARKKKDEEIAKEKELAAAKAKEEAEKKEQKPVEEKKGDDKKDAEEPKKAEGEAEPDKDKDKDKTKDEEEKKENAKPGELVRPELPKPE